MLTLPCLSALLHMQGAARIRTGSGIICLSCWVFLWQAEDTREKAAAAASDAARLAAQAQVLGREAKLGRELRDDNYRLEESLHACAPVALSGLVA